LCKHYDGRLGTLVLHGRLILPYLFRLRITKAFRIVNATHFFFLFCPALRVPSKKITRPSRKYKSNMSKETID